jgi:uncharacterized phage-associated protein
MKQDVRAIGNLALSLANEKGIAVSNLSLNKILYFAHAHYLLETGRPLTTAKIEAWQYGPVFRELYRSLKKYGSENISEYIMKICPDSGESVFCEHDLESQDLEFVSEIILRYLPLSSSALVNISHEPGGPWDQVWNHVNNSQPTMRISNELILNHFEKARRH